MRLLYNQEADFRQRRDFGQKFTATFEFIGAHWHALGRCLLYLALPAALLQGIITGLVQQKAILSSADGAAAGGGSKLEIFSRQMALFSTMRQSPYYWLSVALSAVFVTVIVLTVFGYVVECLRPVPSAEPITPRQVWAVVKREFLSSYLAYFILLIIIIIGFFLLGIPGMYMAVAFSLFFMVKLVEGQDFIGNCQRCLSLVKGKWWSTCGLLLVISLVMGIVAAVVGGMVGGLSYLLLQHIEFGGSGGRSVLTVVLTAVGGLLNLLVYLPLMLAIAFQYFNLVERRDGTGLHQLVGQIGQAPVAVANADLRADEEGEY
ncbi:MAG: hypothetical protein M3Y54_19475 [Bacteroidota bacterium]|nr:hypothetical protein [Bacteroidota bacterium]